MVTENAGAGNDTLRLSFAQVGAARLIDLSEAGLLENLENATVLGTGLFNLTGNAADNILIGNASNNILIGNDGNDKLNGGAGNDTMIGGNGNDIYTVDSVGDVVNEGVGEGDNDTVNASLNFSLMGGFVENLSLIGTAANATGNNMANVLTGNASANVLLGAGGDDTLNGGAGNDTLNGGTGNDNMNGGDGKDTYVVDSSGDTVTETNAAAAGGIDLVQSSVNFTLGANVENLTLTGSNNTDGTGNTLNNIILGNAGANVLTGAAGNDTLTGNAGNDTLDGGTGKDALTGGLGNDSYTVDGVSATTYDVVTEAAGAGSGNDTVLFGGSGTYVLAANVEQLSLLEAAGNANGKGNALANTITGNSGNNVLDGKAGLDTLTGGAGDDAFVFSTALVAGNIDTVTDFGNGIDTLQFNNALFTSLGAEGALNAAAFKSGAGLSAGQDANDRLIYDTSTGNLYYDADGSGAGVAVHVVSLAGIPTLSASDIAVI